MKASGKVISLNESVTCTSPEALVKAFGDAEHNKCGTLVDLMRSLILNAKDFPADDETRSLRGFWYKYIKPALSALGYMEKRDPKDDPGRRWSMDLSQELENQVSAGNLTYEGMNIEDESRSLDRPSGSDVEESDPSVMIAGYQQRGRIYPEIILAIEKDSEYGTAAGIADVLGCSALSGKGKPSLAAMEKLIGRCKYEIHERDITIVALVDYDPSGYQIAGAFRDQAETIARNVGLSGRVTLRKVGITPDQFTARELRTVRYDLTASGKGQQTILDNWMAETRGIGGKPYGIELDALPRSTMRRLYVEGVRDLIDPEEILSDARRETIADIVAETISEGVIKVVDDLYEMYAERVTPIEADIFEIAKQGKSFSAARRFEAPIEKIKEAVRHSILLDYGGGEA